MGMTCPQKANGRATGSIGRYFQHLSTTRSRPANTGKEINRSIGTLADVSDALTSLDKQAVPQRPHGLHQAPSASDAARPVSRRTDYLATRGTGRRCRRACPTGRWTAPRSRLAPLIRPELAGRRQSARSNTHCRKSYQGCTSLQRALDCSDPGFFGGSTMRGSPL